MPSLSRAAVLMLLFSVSSFAESLRTTRREGTTASGGLLRKVRVTHGSQQVRNHDQSKHHRDEQQNPKKSDVTRASSSNTGTFTSNTTGIPNPNSTGIPNSNSTGRPGFNHTGTPKPQNSTNRSSQMFQWPGLRGGYAGPLVYHGGQLMRKPMKVHLIYYGNWTQSASPTSLEGFVESLSSPAADSKGATVYKWWQMLTQYKDRKGKPITSNVTLGKKVYATTKYKTHLHDGLGSGRNEVWRIVKDLIKSKELPSDSSSFYAVITSGDVSIGDSIHGFCGSNGYCGWHSEAKVSGTSIRYGLIGDGTIQCNSGCGHNKGLKATPNGQYRLDSLISTFAHELAETASNPGLDSGYWALDKDGSIAEENGDLCNRQYTEDGLLQVVYNSNWSYAYNLLGQNGLKFLVQTNVDLAKQKCVLQFST